MGTITNSAGARHGSTADVTRPDIPAGIEQTFSLGLPFGVSIIPVRAVPAPDAPADCEPLHRHQPAGTDLGPLVAFDARTRLGGWRRRWCCGRCLSELVAPHPEAVVWVQSGRVGIADAPGEPGETAQWPAEALGGAA